jgi:uncharacterized membrane protein
MKMMKTMTMSFLLCDYEKKSIFMSRVLLRSKLIVVTLLAMNRKKVERVEKNANERTTQKRSVRTSSRLLEEEEEL